MEAMRELEGILGYSRIYLEAILATLTTDSALDGSQLA